MSIKKAIAAGHICLDITPAFKSKEEKNIKDLFRPGQLIAMDAAKVSLGGSVSNTGVGMKRLGADVELMGIWSIFLQILLLRIWKNYARIRSGMQKNLEFMFRSAGISLSIPPIGC